MQHSPARPRACGCPGGHKWTDSALVKPVLDACDWIELRDGLARLGIESSPPRWLLSRLHDWHFYCMLHGHCLLSWWWRRPRGVRIARVLHDQDDDQDEDSDPSDRGADYDGDAGSFVFLGLIFAAPNGPTCRDAKDDPIAVTAYILGCVPIVAVKAVGPVRLIRAALITTKILTACPGVLLATEGQPE